MGLETEYLEVVTLVALVWTENLIYLEILCLDSRTRLEYKMYLISSIYDIDLDLDVLGLDSLELNPELYWTRD